ncbi:toxin-antitoxin system YwqK family antitoxin [Pinibacter aurantiacus]|uniref:Toxin-antitoxin system YwqK family antitoxin n=1 Tax=Pinibacter aurantiacus TaxID=2851599 RepID=A0A9E2W6J4_9BACT|nr:hypothetical protein [Pinibacter aurantiacus]MBV4359898.1 hypothetical protein [Pinibacter aurantiacus]
MKRNRTYFIFFVVTLSLFSCSDKKNNDVEIEYFENGNFKTIQHFKNGDSEGQSIWFYENGNIQQIVNFKNDKANGNAFYFYSSGSLKSHRYWLNDTLNGYVTDYFDDTVGLIKTASLYKNGVVVYSREHDSLTLKK